MGAPAGSMVERDTAVQPLREPWTEPLTRIRFLWVPGGTFTMGSAEDEPASYDDERPAHAVTLRGFWLAETPVTNQQHAAYLEAEPDAPEPRYWRDRRFSGREQPVVGVTWYDAVAFCRWLGRASQRQVELPSEAQWEYAARGPEGRRHPWGDEPPDQTRGCFGLDLTTGQTAPVGQYPRGRGPFGHLDLAGNVWEWCRDTWDAAAYSQEALWSRPSPMLEDDGVDERACRGSSWGHPAGGLRAAYRHHHRADGWGGGLGFRVCIIVDD